MGLGVLVWPLISWVLCQVLEELKACRAASWDLAPEWKGGTAAEWVLCLSRDPRQAGQEQG